jgi:hypothetical protein
MTLFGSLPHYKANLSETKHPLITCSPMGTQLLSTIERREVLPESYIRPESDRPRLAEVTTDSNVPLIDLSSPDKQRVIADIGLACRTYGFFQVALPL